MAGAAVLFDLDGVLILSEAAHWQSWRQVAQQRGVQLTAAMFKQYFGRTNDDTIRALFGALPAADRQRIAEHKEQLWRDAIRAAVPLAPGAIAVLTALRAAGHALALGSSAPAANVDAALDGTGLRPLLPVVVDGNMVQRGKPDPEVFARCAAALGVEPARCVVVEDALAGIAAALAGGMRAIGVATTHPDATLRRAGAHDVVAALRELSPARVAAVLPGD
jgi:beta-phosphoglucomutase